MGRARCLVVCLLALGCMPAGVATAGPGDLDPAFDGDGRVTIDHAGWTGANAPTVHAVGGGELLVAGQVYRSGYEVGLAVARLASDGRVVRSSVTELDTDDPDATDRTTRAVRHGDGLVVAATNDLDPPAVRLMRFGGDAQLDQGFGVGGVATFMPGRAERLAVQRDDGQDKILVASGWTRETACQDDDCTYESGVRLFRVDEDGDLDPSFGDAGQVERTLFGPDACPTAKVTDLELLPDGDLLVAYSGLNAPSDRCRHGMAPPTRAFVTRLDAAGDYAEDPAFGRREIRPDGAYFIDIADADLVPGGGILLTGGVEGLDRESHPGRAWIARLDEATGALDTSFGDGGFRKLALDAATARANMTELQPDGQIVMAVERYGSTQPGFGMTRLSADGVRDESIGAALADFDAPWESAGAVTLDADRIVVAGVTAAEDGSRHSVARFLTAPDPPPQPAGAPSDPRPAPPLLEPPLPAPPVRELLAPRIASPVRVDRRGRFRVGCVTRGVATGVCRVSATVTRRRGAKRRRAVTVTLARGSALIRGGDTTVTLRLTRIGRAALPSRRRRSLPVTLKTTVAEPGRPVLRRSDSARLRRGAARRAPASRSR